jgi:DNA-binding transcriptional MerR regulator
MNTVVEKTGFSPALLRAWERRHDLLEPERTEGGHRLYTDDDLAVLAQVKELLDAGRAIGEIASLGRGRLLESSARAVQPVTVAFPVPRKVAGELSGWSLSLVEAAVAVDEARVEAALDQAFSVLSPQRALNDVVLPALVTVGELWAQGRCSISGEHLASAKVVGRLLKLLETVNPPRSSGAGIAIAACFPDERHEIGALMASCLLARYHFHVSYLGACLPLEDLERSCSLLTPNVLCLSVSREALLVTHTPRLLELVKRLPDTVQVYLGGLGVTSVVPELVQGGVRLIVPGGPSLEDMLSGKASPPSLPKRRVRRSG